MVAGSVDTVLAMIFGSIQKLDWRPRFLGTMKFKPYWRE